MIGRLSLLAVLTLGTFVVAGDTIFLEKFEKGWNSKWEVSDWKKDEGINGKWGWSHGAIYGDPMEDKGLVTTQDARYYGITAQISDTPFDNVGRDFVLQFSAKFPENMDCGGGYIKVLRAGVDPKKFSGSTPYAIMFGPDICGSETRKTRVILNHNGTNLEKNTEVLCENDKFTHFYTLIIHPDNTFAVKIDNKEKDSGSLFKEWNFLKPRQIPDPSAQKPSDWVDDPLMDDPKAVKPADWDDEPQKIPDETAVKPDDWDDQADGIWDVPLIPNPKYKGQWKAPRINNPDYKGKWIAPLIDNPEFVDDQMAYAQKDLQYVGFELWQVKSGLVLDNILITDNVEEASNAVDAWLKKNQPLEKKMNDDKEKAERLERERERKEQGMGPEAQDEFDLDEENDIDLTADDEDDEKEEL